MNFKTGIILGGMFTCAAIFWSLAMYTLGLRHACQAWHYNFEDLSVQVCEVVGVLPDDTANLTFRKGLIK